MEKLELLEVFMLPDPLHPAVVHFPLVLAFLLPISALAGLWAIRRGVAPWRAWAVPAAFALALTASAWVALETGQDQEERVERVVAENVLHAHEEAADRFLLFSGATTLVLLVGLAGGALGTSARVLGTAGALALIVAGVQVGAAGGELVYRHGAASAYVQGPTGAGEQGVPVRNREADRD